MIDLIMPLYNGGKVLDRTLCSIAHQNVAKDMIEVFIVDDCSTKDNENYQTVIDKYRDNFKSIKIERLEENRGPGFARAYALERTSNPFILFMDADDMYYDCFAIERLYEEYNYNARRERVIMVTAPFLQETEDKGMIRHSDIGTWVFSKLYVRKLIEKHNIKFPEYRSNEDVGFNTRLLFLAKENNYIYLNLTDPCYVWLFNENSITRHNGGHFTFTDGFEGYITNKIEPIKEFWHLDFAKEHAIAVFTICYKSYNESVLLRPDHVANVLEQSRRFCKEVFNCEYNESAFKAGLRKAENTFKELEFIPIITIWDFARLCNMKLIK